MVVSNPPYLREPDLLTLQPEVRFEPKRALAGGRNGLRAYRTIVKSVQSVLKKSGLVAFEVGFAQAEAVAQLLAKNSFCDVRVSKDLAGVERIISAQLVR